VRVPLAVTVIAGLLSATFLTLIVIPLIYSVVSREGSGVPNTNSQGTGLSPD
jgi:Cu/Ag efflux pump CusA